MFYLVASAATLIYYHISFSLSTTFYLFSKAVLSKESGERGIWTLAPLLTTYSLSRGAPSATWVFLQNACPRQFIKLLFSHTLSCETERVGFEPTRPCGQTVFKTASLWPLRYLSMSALHKRLCYSSSIRSFCQLYFPIFFDFFYFSFTDFKKARIYSLFCRNASATSKSSGVVSFIFS